MNIDDMIIENNREFGAMRLLRLLTENNVFSDEVKQALRLEGMKLLSDSRNFKDAA